MIRRFLLTIALLLFAGTSEAQDLVLDGNTFGKLGWQDLQAVDRSRLRGLLDRGLLEPVAAYGHESAFRRLGRNIGFVDVLRSDNLRAP